MLAAREHVSQRHGPNGGVILIEHAFARASTLRDVAFEAAAQAFLIAGRHEDAEVEERANVGMMERENPFHNEDRPRIDAARRGGARVLIEEINRLLNGFPACQRAEVLGEKRPIEGVWMVVIEGGALFEREMGLRVIISVEREDFCVEMGR